MKVTGKLMTPFLALATALIAVLVMGLWANDQISTTNAKADLANQQMILASEVRALSRAIQRDAINTIFDQDKLRDGFLKSIAKRSAQMLDLAKKLNVLFGPEDSARMKGFLETQEIVVREINATTAFAQKGDKEAAYNWFRQHVRAAERSASQLVDTFIDDNEKRISALAKDVANTRETSNIMLIAFAIITLASTLGAGIVIVMRAIVRPIRGLVEGVNAIAQGQYSTAIAGTKRRDEIGMVAKALDQFRGDLAKMVALRAEQEQLQMSGQEERQRAAAEQERLRQAAQDERERTAAEQSKVLQSIANGLGQLSEGNLTHRIEEGFPASYLKLKEDFNSAMNKLQDTIAVIVESTRGIHSGSGEISHAADDLSQRTERQAASLEQTAAALREIIATVHTTTERTEHATAIVNDAQSEADNSAKVMRSAVAAMSDIEQSVKKIAQIIGVIDEIAFQTNLLALNAGVEAARAGEVGRGFAVVAGEVRSLAQRSADAAREIKSLIEVSTKQVTTGVGTISKAGETLERIVARVDDIRGVVTEISTAARGQETGLGEVNTAIAEMDAVTQQNAAMVEQSTAASHSFASEADQLAALMTRFRISKDNRPATRSAAA